MAATLYWYDYETFGADPVRDRPAQFAGLRTDEDLKPIGEPLTLYCRPANDFLPHPVACLITGITPQLARDKGVCEAHFIGRIREQFSQPQTCISGYNNLRFDDEVTRHTLYRNLFDPYQHEWRHGNSRWDLIDVMRLTYALRPEGIHWPRRQDGALSFRLEDLTRANDIEHRGAHDALADVKATIELARLLKSTHSRLYQYCFQHRRKQALQPLIDLEQMKPFIHVSEKYPATQGCLAMVAPVARVPDNPNAVIVVDLNSDPEPLLILDGETLKERLFTPKQDLPRNVERPGLKTLRINRCPVIAPVSTLQPGNAERLGIDLDRCRRNLEILRRHRSHLRSLLSPLFEYQDGESCTDPDLMLYRGGFFSDDDRRRMEYIHSLAPQELPFADLHFDDPRLPEMLFRCRARNWPETLNQEELRHWEAFRCERLTSPSGGASLTWEDFWVELRCQDSEKIQADKSILEALEAYAREISPPQGHCHPDESLS